MPIGSASNDQVFHGIYSDSMSKKLKKSVKDHGIRDICKYLEKGADPDTLCQVRYRGKDMCISVVYLAFLFKNYELFTYIMSFNPSIDRDKCNHTSMFCQAYTRSHVENIDCYKKYCRICDRFIQYFINHNIHIQTIDHAGKSVLHYIVMRRDLSLLKCLMSRIVDINQPDANGCTPLYYACKYQSYGIIKYLLLQGALINKPSNKGETPVGVFITCYYDEKLYPYVKKSADVVLDYLMRRGASFHNSGTT
jgi:hypothetical protein